MAVIGRLPVRVSASRSRAARSTTSARQPVRARTVQAVPTAGRLSPGFVTSGSCSGSP